MTVANIGAGERRKRRILAIVGLGISVVLAAALIRAHVPAWWRLALFVPLFIAALGYFQDRDKT